MTNSIIHEIEKKKKECTHTHTHIKSILQKKNEKLLLYVGKSKY